MRLVVATVFFAAFVLATAYRAAVRGDAARFPFDSSLRYVVTRAVDGDTLLLESGHRVRLLGVDTPETVHPTRGEEPFGREASDFAKARTTGRAVTLEFDRERTDHYDRVLAWVFVGDELLNESLVAAGLSPVVRISPLRPDYEKRLLAAERAAKAAGLGIWSDAATPRH